jgi:hypothetical protein
VDIGGGGTPAINPADVLPCNPNASLPINPNATNAPGATTAPGGGGGGGGGGVGGGPDSGIGSLAASGTGIPLWALLVAGLSLLGLLAGIGLSASSLRASNREE